MHNLTQIFLSTLAGGFLLFIVESKIIRLIVTLSMITSIINGMGIPWDKNIAVLFFVFTVWLCFIIYFRYKPKDSQLSKEFIDDLKTRIAVRDALLPAETAVSPPITLSTETRIVDIIELTEEEKIANLEKEAALAERETEALLKRRAAKRKLQKAIDEDAAEIARVQKALEKEQYQPPPPMTPEQKVQAILELETARSKHIQQLRDAGHLEDSLAIAAIDVEYDNKLKSLHSIRTAK